MRYCIGDIHGCFKTFQELIGQILLESKSPDIYLVGDLIDRGPDSKAVLDFIFELKHKGIRINAVRGNHENMLINAYQNNHKVPDTQWYNNGAKATIMSMNPDADLQLKVQELIPVKYYEYLISLPFFIELEDYIIVHAGLNMYAKNAFTDYETMLWTRDEKYNPTLVRGKNIIHGHTPVPFHEIRSRIESGSSNIINIDSGCVYNHLPVLGNLTCINLDTNKLICVKNIDFKF